MTSGLTCKVAPSDALTTNTTVFVKRCHQNYINLMNETGRVPNCKVTGKNTDESLIRSAVCEGKVLLWKVLCLTIFISPPYGKSSVFCRKGHDRCVCGHG